MNRYEVVTRSGRAYTVVADDWTTMLDGKLLLFTDENDYTIRAFPVDNLETWGKI